MYDIQVSVSLPIDAIGYSTCFVIYFSTVFAVVAYSTLYVKCSIVGLLLFSGKTNVSVQLCFFLLSQFLL